MTYRDDTDAALAAERADHDATLAEMERDAVEQAKAFADANTKIQTQAAEIATLKARIAELEAGEPPVDDFPGVLYGSTSKADSFAALDSKLAAAVGGSRPVLMADHMYDGGKGIPTSLPADLTAGGLMFGMYNVRGSVASPAVGNLPRLAASLPAGYTLYLPIFHEPEDDTDKTPATFWAGVMKVCRAIWALPAGTFKEGASIVPVVNFHGRLFDGRAPSSWGGADAWRPPASVTLAERDRMVGSLNGYSTGDVAGYDTPEEVFGPGFDKLREWGFTRLGVCEWGYYPRTSGAYIDAASDLFEAEEVEFAFYFHSDAGSNSPNGTWALDTQPSLQAYARAALNGRRT